MIRKRMKRNDRKAAILDAALTLAVKIGYRKLTRDNVAKAAGVSGPTVMHHFNTMRNLQNRVLLLAVERSTWPVVVQGLAIKDPIAMKIPTAVQRSILRNWSRSL